MVRGIVVCVDYDDLLKITLPRNMRFLDECVVVTSPTDERTKEVASLTPRCRLYQTDAFYRYGAKFNKGLAIEEGFDFLGREGWILIWDADILLPNTFKFPQNLRCGTLYGCHRRILERPELWHPEFNWNKCQFSPDGTRVSGYFQLFHADDPHIATRPWYDVCFSHAGGGDGYFDNRWPRSETAKLDIVLHLGPRDSNWFGRVTKRTDNGQHLHDVTESQAAQEQYIQHKGWHNTAQKPYVEFDERVEVPGHQPSSFVPISARKGRQ